MSLFFTALNIVKQQGFGHPPGCKASRKDGVVIVETTRVPRHPPDAKHRGRGGVPINF